RVQAQLGRPGPPSQHAAAADEAGRHQVARCAADRDLVGPLRGPEDSPQPPSEPVVDVRLTFGDVCDRYMKEDVRVPGRRERAIDEIDYQVMALRKVDVAVAGGETVKMELVPMDSITKVHVEAFRTARRDAAARAKERFENWRKAVAEAVEAGQE